LVAGEAIGTTSNLNDIERNSAGERSIFNFRFIILIPVANTSTIVFNNKKHKHLSF